jgi:hypothetical protein
MTNPLEQVFNFAIEDRIAALRAIVAGLKPRTVRYIEKTHELKLLRNQQLRNARGPNPCR